MKLNDSSNGFGKMFQIDNSCDFFFVEDLDRICSDLSSKMSVTGTREEILNEAKRAGVTSGVLLFPELIGKEGQRVVVEVNGRGKRMRGTLKVTTSYNGVIQRHAITPRKNSPSAYLVLKP